MTDQKPNLSDPLPMTPIKKAAPTDFPGMLKAYLPEIKRALPKHMDGDRMARVALTCFRQNPKLVECEPKSVFASIIIGSQLGLEPGILGQAFLVPYKKVCQLIPGWQGLADLVSRAGRASVWTGAVYQGDHFTYEFGTSPLIHHIPSGDDDMNDLTHVYAVGRIKGAEFPVIEVWTTKKAERHRDRYNKVGDKHYSFENFEMYARKVALLQVLKYMPKSVELATAIALNNAAETNSQNVDLKDAIQGTWAPAAEDAADPAPVQTSAEPAKTEAVSGNQKEASPALQTPDKSGFTD